MAWLARAHEYVQNLLTVITRLNPKGSSRNWTQVDGTKTWLDSSEPTELYKSTALFWSWRSCQTLRSRRIHLWNNKLIDYSIRRRRELRETHQIVDANAVVRKDCRYLVEEFAFCRIPMEVVPDTRSAPKALMKTSAVVSDGRERTARSVVSTHLPLVLRVRHVKERSGVLENVNFRRARVQTFQMLHLTGDEDGGNGKKRDDDKNHIVCRVKWLAPIPMFCLLLKLYLRPKDRNLLTQ